MDPCEDSALEKLSLSSLAWHATFGLTALVYAVIALSGLSGSPSNLIGIAIYVIIVMALGVSSSVYLVHQLCSQKLKLGYRNDWVLLQIGILIPLNNVIANSLLGMSDNSDKHWLTYFSLLMVMGSVFTHLPPRHVAAQWFLTGPIIL